MKDERYYCVVWWCSMHALGLWALSLAVSFVVCVLLFIFHFTCNLSSFDILLVVWQKDSDRFSVCMTFVIFQIRFRMVDRHLRAWKYVITSLLLLLFTDWKIMLRREKSCFELFVDVEVYDSMPSWFDLLGLFSVPIFNWIIFSLSVVQLIEMARAKRIDNV